jgi:hypothetical protein
MSRKPKYHYLLEKSIHSSISAIEIYNKPDFKYREEAFVILITNSWELLFKAKILKDNNNTLSSLYLIDPNKTLTKKGKDRKRLAYKTNRCGNFSTIDIFKSIEKINKQNLSNNVERTLKDNIEILVELRDNAIHFINESPYLTKKVLEISTATLKSYLIMVNEWFSYDLSRYNFYLMPISFFHTFEMESFSINGEQEQIKNLLKFIFKKEIDSPYNEDSQHNISLVLETKFVKSNSPNGLNVKYSNDANISVKVDAEQVFANKYPTDYEALLTKLKSSYIDFKMDKKFWGIKANLEKDNKYCGERYLDMKKESGTKKKYYSTEIYKEFDLYYTKKIPTLF